MTLSKYFPQGTLNMNIQWLRGFSVLAVVLFHINSGFFSNGYLGVDIFFVISGYVISPQLLYLFNTNINIKTALYIFFIRRILRLAPVFLTITILFGLIIFLIGPFMDHHRIYGQLISSYLFIGNIGAYKFGHNYFHPQPNPLLHLWSLSAEEQIYFFLPFILLFFSYLKFRNFLNIYISLLFIFVFSHFMLLQYPSILKLFGIDDNQGFLYYFVTLHLCEFLIGSILSTQKNKLTRFREIRFQYFFFILGFFIFLYKFQNTFLVYFLAFLWTFFLLLLFGNNGPNLPFRKLLVWLGDRSYSIYLLHLPILYLFRSTQFFAFIPNLLSIPIAVCTVLILANLTYLKIENRFRLSKNTIIDLKPIKLKLSFISYIHIFMLIVWFALWNLGGQSFVTDKSQIPERAWLIDKNCYILGAQLCSYPKNDSGKKALLIGDSHAGAIARSFIKVANEQDYSAYVFAWGGCPTISKSRMSEIRIQHYKFPQSVLLTKKEPPWCPQYVDEILQILKTNQFDVLFISNDCSWCNESTLRANALTALDLSKFVKNSFFIGQTPVFNDPLDFNPSIFSPPGPEFPIEIEKMNQTSFMQDKYMAKFFIRHDMAYIPTSDIFCDGNFCYPYLFGSFMFVDYNHLSIKGASLLEPRLQWAFSYK